MADRAGPLSSECRHAHIARRAAELAAERPAEGRSVKEAEILGDLVDILPSLGIGQGPVCAAETLRLYVASDAPARFEEPIELGARHADQAAEPVRGQSRRAEVLTDGQ